MEEQSALDKQVELTVWLKDFPKTADDFRELRRSGAQHQPEIEVALEGLFMVEEEFLKDDDDEDDIGVTTRPDSSVDDQDAIDEAE